MTDDIRDEFEELPVKRAKGYDIVKRIKAGKKRLAKVIEKSHEVKWKNQLRKWRADHK
jgi:hypothetical protein